MLLYTRPGKTQDSLTRSPLESSWAHLQFLDVGLPSLVSLPDAMSRQEYKWSLTAYGSIPDHGQNTIGSYAI